MTERISETADLPGNSGRTRDGVELIPQRHGGALRPPFPRGQSPGGFRRTKREALALLHAGTPHASRRLLELVNSDDDRVAVVAVTQLLDRMLGKPSEVPQQDDGSGGSIDLSQLTADERGQLVEAVSTVRRLRALAAERAAAKHEPRHDGETGQ